MNASEQEELAQLREQITTRMHELQQDVDELRIHADQREEQLKQEFGEDFRETLRSLNELLSHQPSTQAPANTALAAFVATLVGFVLLATTLNAFALTGAATSTHTTALNLELSEETPLPLYNHFTLHAIHADVQATNYTLYLRDGHAEHEIQRLQDNQLTCTGCGETYRPPFTLRVETDGQATINAITHAQT